MFGFYGPTQCSAIFQMRFSFAVGHPSILKIPLISFLQRPHPVTLTNLPGKSGNNCPLLAEFAKMRFIY